MVEKKWMTGSEINKKFNRSKRWAWTVANKNSNIRTKQIKTGTLYNGSITLFNVDDFRHYIEQRTTWKNS